MKYWLTVVVALVSLTACQQSVPVRSAAEGRYLALEGAQLVVKRPLKVAAGQARVFLQNGVAGSGFGQYQPHCAFEIRRVDHPGFTIEPGTFTITRVQSSIQQVVQRELPMLASLNLVAMDGMDGSGSSSYHEGYHLWLSSTQQPEVRRLSCFGVFAVPADLYPPTLEEIGGALGDYAEIRR